MKRMTLREMFTMGEAGPVGPGGKLRPEQEKLVKDAAAEIVGELIAQNQGYDKEYPEAQEYLESVLTQLVIDSEKAEGEDPEHG